MPCVFAAFVINKVFLKYNICLMFIELYIKEEADTNIVEEEVRAPRNDFIEELLFDIYDSYDGIYINTIRRYSSHVGFRS